ncbi:hypothetical protein CQW23_23277 [Capsicum baccatum]|uniref:Uncharacterized protein n=1 Tax=Capsicum baccatum TaxID=33114 RepID=A0A2G2VRG5_CAPBA|nr:hypothetical protein CQW23_23277 [Capsicum baccatum]
MGSTCEQDVNCKLERNDNGSYIVRISANSTIVVAELRRPLELLMRGKDFGSSDNVDRAEQRFIDFLLALHESKQLEVHLCGGLLPPDLMKKFSTIFGPDLSVLKENVPGVEFSLNTKRHCIYISDTEDLKQNIEDIIYEIAQSHFPTQTTGNEAHYAVCLCELEDPYRLEACTHAFYCSFLLEQCESVIKSWEGFPMCYLHSGCGEPFLLADLKSLLSIDKLEEIFKASLGAFVTPNVGTYCFCPSPDCHLVYQITASDMEFGAPFVCDACYGSMSDKIHTIN